MTAKYERVSVYGIGYVGLASCAAWLRAGYIVTGVDTLEERVTGLNSGSITHVEPEVAEEISQAISKGRFKATSDGVYASKHSDVKLISVPVGLDAVGRPILNNLEAAVKTIAVNMKIKDVVILESSVPLGTTLKLVKPLLERASDLKAERDFYLAYSPERIYVGRALEDIEVRYPKIVGGIGPKSSNIVSMLYGRIAKRGVKIVSSTTAAEFEKLAEGVYRAVNIALANELAMVASKAGIDYSEMAEAANSQSFCHLHQPGVGVGGACIPIYPVFLMTAAKDLGVKMDLTRVSRRINSFMPDYTAQLAQRLASMLGLEKAKVTILGLAFRGGIDDTRLSPTYDLINALIKSGIEEITVNDPHVTKDLFLEKLKLKLTKQMDDALKDMDIAILATDHPEYKKLTLKELKDKMCKEKIGVVDGRQIIKEWKNPPEGVAYVGIGRPPKANI